MIESQSIPSKSSDGVASSKSSSDRRTRTKDRKKEDRPNKTSPLSGVGFEKVRKTTKGSGRKQVTTTRVAQEAKGKSENLQHSEKRSGTCQAQDASGKKDRSSRALQINNLPEEQKTGASKEQKQIKGVNLQEAASQEMNAVLDKIKEELLGAEARAAADMNIDDALLPEGEDDKVPYMTEWQPEIRTSSPMRSDISISRKSVSPPSEMDKDDLDTESWEEPEYQNDARFVRDSSK